MNFSDALNLIKAGRSVRRTGWNGLGMWLELQVPDANSKMTLPYIFLSYPVGSKAYPEGARVPWLASQTDLLAYDWIDVDDIHEPLPDLPKLYTLKDLAHYETHLEHFSGRLLYRARMSDSAVFTGELSYEIGDSFAYEQLQQSMIDDINRQSAEGVKK